MPRRHKRQYGLRRGTALDDACLVALIEADRYQQPDVRVLAFRSTLYRCGYTIVTAPPTVDEQRLAEARRA